MERRSTFVRHIVNILPGRSHPTSEPASMLREVSRVTWYFGVMCGIRARLPMPFAQSMDGPVVFVGLLAVGMLVCTLLSLSAERSRKVLSSPVRTPTRQRQKERQTPVPFSAEPILRECFPLASNRRKKDRARRPRNEATPEPRDTLRVDNA